MIKNTDYKKNNEKIHKLLGELAEESFGKEELNLEDKSQFDEKPEKISLEFFDNNHSLGGVTGELNPGYMTLKIEFLAVEKEARGKKVGKKLVDEIEKVAKSKGCKFSFVETVSFSAPNFYKKLGYVLMFELEDYPMEGVTNYFFYKKLD